MLSRRPPRRTYSVRDHGKSVRVYRATKDAWRATWRRVGLSLEAMDEAAEEALGWLAEILEEREDARARAVSAGG